MCEAGSMHDKIAKDWNVMADGGICWPARRSLKAPEKSPRGADSSSA
jgi:hypothetical protein